MCRFQMTLSGLACSVPLDLDQMARVRSQLKTIGKDPVGPASCKCRAIHVGPRLKPRSLVICDFSLLVIMFSRNSDPKKIKLFSRKNRCLKKK